MTEKKQQAEKLLTGFKVSIGDGPVEYVDLRRFMMNETIALQEHTGLQLTGLGERITAGDMKAIKALVWLARLRTLQQEHGCSVDEAAEREQFRAFDFDLQQLRLEGVEAEVPKAPSRTTPTRRDASKTRAATSARRSAGASASSPSSSTSAPGSSTD